MACGWLIGRYPSKCNANFPCTANSHNTDTDPCTSSLAHTHTKSPSEYMPCKYIHTHDGRFCYFCYAMCVYVVADAHSDAQCYWCFSNIAHAPHKWWCLHIYYVWTNWYTFSIIYAYVCVTGHGNASDDDWLMCICVLEFRKRALDERADVKLSAVTIPFPCWNYILHWYQCGGFKHSLHQRSFSIFRMILWTWIVFRHCLNVLEIFLYARSYAYCICSLQCKILISTTVDSMMVSNCYSIGLAVPAVTEPTDEDEDEFDDDEDSSEADDDGRIYKNPRNSPSTECPRDEEQATLLAQKCLRKCSSDEDCKSKKKKCLCDGPCGMSCIKPGRFNKWWYLCCCLTFEMETFVWRWLKFIHS